MNVKRNFIGGEWVGASAAKPNVNPSDTSDVVGEYAQADAAQTAAAVLAARAAFPAWAGGSIQARADSLEKIAAEIMQRKDELGDLLAREEGKTLPEATAEVARAGQIFRFFAGEAVRAGQQLVRAMGATIDVRSELGHGSVFGFTLALPVRAVWSHESRAPDDPPAAGIAVPVLPPEEAKTLADPRYL